MIVTKITTIIAAASNDIDQSIEQSQSIFRKLLDTFFNFHSLGILLICLFLAVGIGRLIAIVLRRTAISVAHQADKTENLQDVLRLRRIETYIVLSIALIRAILLAIAIYFWWNFAYPYHNPATAVGASVIFIVIVGNALGPALRDVAAGSFMMAEQWYGVGDHIRVEPFMDLQGVVERITLRSTRLRDLNGEIIWLNNQNIQGVRVSPRGIRTIAIELFVSDIDKGLQLIQYANFRLPQSPLMLASPLVAMTSSEITTGVWQITAIGETAPGREWLLEKHAIELLTDIDKKEHQDPVLLNAPIARYADSEAERKFARTIKNARKLPRKRRVRKPTTKKTRT